VYHATTVHARGRGRWAVHTAEFTVYSLRHRTGQKVDFLGRCHISTSGFVRSATPSFSWASCFIPARATSISVSPDPSMQMFWLLLLFRYCHGKAIIKEALPLFMVDKERNERARPLVRVLHFLQRNSTRFFSGIGGDGSEGKWLTQVHLGKCCEAVMYYWTLHAVVYGDVV